MHCNLRVIWYILMSNLICIKTQFNLKNQLKGPRKRAVTGEIGLQCLILSVGKQHLFATDAQAVANEVADKSPVISQLRQHQLTGRGKKISRKSSTLVFWMGSLSLRALLVSKAAILIAVILILQYLGECYLAHQYLCRTCSEWLSFFFFFWELWDHSCVLLSVHGTITFV